MSYKITTLGAHGTILCQLDRIDDGLRSLGHEIVYNIEPDFIFVNDYHYHKEGIELKNKYPKAKLILNTLDLANHCKEHVDICNQLDINFHYGDAFTTISETVKSQMLSRFVNLQKSGISVIYQPIKPVYPKNLDRNGKLMMVGRMCDPNKRAMLGILGTILYNGHLDIYGPEDISSFLSPQYKNFITYKGLVSDEELNDAYNTHSILLTTTFNGELNLPLIEALCCKTPIICCSDMDVCKEFSPLEFSCESTPFSICEKIKYIINGSPYINNILSEYSKDYLDKFSSKSIANRIINVYEKI